jgi:hypothetical protein
MIPGPSRIVHGPDCVASSNQERRLVYDECAEELAMPRSSCHVPVVWRIRGPVDLDALEEAVQVVVARHAALRSALLPSKKYSPTERRLRLEFFRDTGLFTPGLYVQSVSAHVPVRIRTMDLDDAGGGSLPARVAAAADAESAAMRNDEPPLLRVLMLRIAPEDHVFVAITSHLISDGWSMKVLLKEMWSAYDGIIAGRALELPEIAVHFPDFAAWETRQLRSGGFMPAIAYWKAQWTQMRDEPIRHHDLPFGLSAAQTDGVTATLHEMPFTPDESARLRTMMGRARITPYVFFRSAVSLLVHGCTGKPRLGMWANFLNRRYATTENTFGWCTNTHLLLTDLSAARTVLDFHRHVATTVSEAMQHQMLSLPALWRAIGRVLDTYGTRVNFDYGQRARLASHHALQLEPLMVSVGREWIDLDIRVRDDSVGFTVMVGHNPQRYDTAGITVLLAALHDLALWMAEHPQASPVEGTEFAASVGRTRTALAG